MSVKYKIVLPKGASWDPMRNSAFSDRMKYNGVPKEAIFEDLDLHASIYACKSGPTLLILDSIVTNNMNPDENDPHDASAKKLIEHARKNPECKIILYTAEPFDIDTTSVDVFINGLDHGSYDRLFEEIGAFTKSN